MATVRRKTPINFGGLISNIMASKQREKEFKRSLPLERRRVAVSERQVGVAEQGVGIAESEFAQKRTEFEVGETHKNVVDQYNMALTDLMKSRIEDEFDKDYQKAQTAFENARIGLTESQIAQGEDILARSKSMQEGMRSSDPATAELARNAYWGTKSTEKMGDVIDSLRLQLQMTQAQHAAMIDQAKLKISQQNSLLMGFKFATEFGPVLEKKIGKEAFKAGYETMSKTLGFDAEGGGGTRPVGGPKASTVPPPWGAPMGAMQIPQMTLEQALIEIKSGAIGIDALPPKWQSLLEGLPAPEPNAPGAAPVPTDGSFENNLIKRLQQ